MSKGNKWRPVYVKRRLQRNWCVRRERKIGLRTVTAQTLRGGTRWFTTHAAAANAADALNKREKVGL